MPRCLVTGAAGFIGSHLCRELAKRHEVVGVDDLSGGSMFNLPSRYEILDVCNVRGVDHMFDSFRPEYVYHLAAYAAEGMSHFIRRYNYTNNLIGSVNLINASIRHKVRCLVFASSMAVYGHTPSPLLEDYSPCQPADPYGVAKLAVELDLEAARRSHGLNYVVVRPHNVYGPGQSMCDPFRNVVAIFMRQCLRGESMTIFGNGSQRRQFTYVSDIVPMIAACPWVTETHGKRINLGSSAVHSVADIARMVRIACDRDLDAGTVYLPERNEVKEAYADHCLQNSLLGQCKTPLDVGLKRMAQWAREQPSIPERPLPFTVELADGMPPSWRKRAGVPEEVEA